MNKAELQEMDAFHRRRLFLSAFLALFLGVLTLTGWRPTPIWNLFGTDEGTFAAGDPFGEWIYAVCDGDRQQVVVSRNGKLAGAAALGSLHTLRFPNWCDLPTVDSPDLADWRSQLGRLTTLTSEAGSTAAEILGVARQMPVSYLYLKPLSDWIHADRAHAAGFLDAIAQRPMRFDHPNPAIVRIRKEYFSGLVADALESAATGDVAPERLGRWLTAPQIAGSGKALRLLARTNGVGPHEAGMILERLEGLRPSERGELYQAVAPQLVPQSEYAALLARQLRLVPHQSRFLAAQQLLARPDGSVEFAIALLSDLRRTFGRAETRLQVFMAIANDIRHEAEAPMLLTRHLRDLPPTERLTAATYLLSLDEPGETAFGLGVLRALSDLHPMSRPKVMYAILQSEQFRNPAVQEACLLTIQMETRDSDQHALLRAMLNHRELDDDLESRIRAALGA
jgi:hypothetical protein